MLLSYEAVTFMTPPPKKKAGNLWINIVAPTHASMNKRGVQTGKYSLNIYTFITSVLGHMV